MSRPMTHRDYHDYEDKRHAGDCFVVAVILFIVSFGWIITAAMHAHDGVVCGFNRVTGFSNEYINDTCDPVVIEKRNEKLVNLMMEMYDFPRKVIEEDMRLLIESVERRQASVKTSMESPSSQGADTDPTSSTAPAQRPGADDIASK